MARAQPKKSHETRVFAEHAPIVLDVAGITLNAADRRRLAHPLVGGAILFGRNWVDRWQVTELVAEMKAKALKAVASPLPLGVSG